MEPQTDTQTARRIQYVHMKIAWALEKVRRTDLQMRVETVWEYVLLWLTLRIDCGRLALSS
jgi:hypothetical protein